MNAINNKSTVQIVNGYRMLYRPDHSKAFKTNRLKGWVYEHVLICERYLDRTLEHDEVVHHLDLDRSNNKYSNLLVIDRGQHAKLHMWLNAGYPIKDETLIHGMKTTPKPTHELKYCEICDITLQYKQQKFCSNECEAKGREIKYQGRTKHLPSKDELIKLGLSNSREAIGRMYNVSGNAVKKWMIKYGLNTNVLNV